MLTAPSPRIVSLLPSATEIVSALGFADALVGRSHECDFPLEVRKLPVCTAPKLDPTGSSREIHARIEELLSEAISVYRVDAELLLALAPTHVLTQVHCDVCAVNLADVRSAVAGWTPAPTLVALGASTISEAMRDIERVAAALGVPQRGAAVTSRLVSRMEAIRDAAVYASRRPRVATIEWLSPPMAAGNWIPELVRMAGGENLFGEMGRHSPWLGPDALREADPDIIVAFPCGFGLERSETDAGLLEEIPGWETLAAVRRGAVYLADGNQFFNRPGPRLVESLEILAEILHPDRFDFGHRGAAWRKAPAAKPVSSDRS
ncbi:MAG: cobalamin-binding protein [Acidobacteriota bacterium]